MYTPLALLIMAVRFVLFPVRWIGREIVICSAPKCQQTKLRTLNYWADDTFWRTLPCAPDNLRCTGPYRAIRSGDMDLGRSRNACRSAGASEWRMTLLEGRYAMPWVSAAALAAT